MSKWAEKSQRGQAPSQQIVLQNDMGGDFAFKGWCIGEHEFFDEENGILTRQKLYKTVDGHRAYSVIASDGRHKERRAYLIRREGPLCKINNGLFDVTVSGEDLVRVVRGLCGLTETVKAEDFFIQVEQAFKTAVNE